MRASSMVLALGLMAAPGAVIAEGLLAPPTALGGSRWQMRIEVETTWLQSGGSALGLGGGANQQSARLFRDYQLDALRLGQTGGLRLTSGVLLSQRSGSSAADSDSRTAWPYFGIGYRSGSLRGDWGFSADVGMAAQNAGSVLQLGRVLGGSSSLNDVLRELRLLPMVRLGVNYSF